MRLTRIIAERFGSLRSATLGELGDGLTVVLGPNEAGKTSFTTLVRYVLYGYPTKRDSEPDYESDAGKRLGRLVFADGHGQWAVERAEGVHGGPVALHALEGSDRPDLIGEVTRGISRDAFRVVFGFGLDEMVQIEAGRGTGVDILSRLYAAKVGLDVSPSDVRAAFEAEAGELWRPSGRNPELNALKSSITETKRRIAELESAASGFAQDQLVLARLGQELADARDLREGTAARAAELGSAAQQAADLETRYVEAREEADSAHVELAAAQAKRAAIVVDERVIAVASELDSALDDLSGFKTGLRAVSESWTEITALQQQADVLLSQAGIDPVAAAAADLGPETVAGIARGRDELAALGSQATVSRRSAQSAIDAAQQDPGAGTDSGSSGSSGMFAGGLVAAAGLAVAVMALLARDYVQAALGVLAAGAGVFLLLRTRRGGSAARTSEHLNDLRRAAAVAESAAQRDAQELEAARARWAEWLTARGLDAAGEDPTAVSMLFEAIREARAAHERAARLVLTRDSQIAELSRYRELLARLSQAFDPGVASVELEELPVRAARLRQTLDAELRAARARDELGATVEALSSVVTNSERRALAATESLAALLERVGLAGADTVLLAGQADVAREAAAQAAAAFDHASREYTALATRLDNQGRDDAMATLRLELAGLVTRREAALERYTVLALAERLMARTQAYHEQARQPEVIGRASELFEMITEGRYVKVSVPSDGSEFMVFDADSRQRPSSELSTGTAQQLYLAIRIALIETLDEVGLGLPVLMDDVLVNFDPERKRGAAQAISHLATHRQVIMFTCHPETAELMDRVAPGHTRLTLDRC